MTADLTEPQWKLIQPLLPPPKATGQPQPITVAPSMPSSSCSAPAAAGHERLRGRARRDRCCGGPGARVLAGRAAGDVPRRGHRGHMLPRGIAKSWIRVSARRALVFEAGLAGFSLPAAQRPRGR